MKDVQINCYQYFIIVVIGIGIGIAVLLIVNIHHDTAKAIPHAILLLQKMKQNSVVWTDVLDPTIKKSTLT